MLQPHHCHPPCHNRGANCNQRGKNENIVAYYFLRHSGPVPVFALCVCCPESWGQTHLLYRCVLHKCASEVTISRSGLCEHFTERSFRPIRGGPEVYMCLKVISEMATGTWNDYRSPAILRSCDLAIWWTWWTGWSGKKKHCIKLTFGGVSWKWWNITFQQAIMHDYVMKYSISPT